MFRNLVASLLLIFIAASARAQTQKMPADLAALPDEIKNLKWQSIDPNAATVLDRCRALLLLNHSLDELSANAAAEADLMSTYIEQKNLGAAFAKTPPPPAAGELSYADSVKVALALLRGPMSTSYYAKELGDVGDAGLASYEQMYRRTCQRRWSEVDESRTQVRAMTSFLGNSQKLDDYDAWATAEAALRQKGFEQKTGAAPAKEQQQQGQKDAQVHALEHENQQLRQALGVAQSQQAGAQANPQGGQSGQATGQPAQDTSNQGATDTGIGYDGYFPYGYGAYGYGYGRPGAAAAAGAYAGAAVARNQYHGANSGWTHDDAYRGAARAQTEQRMSGFHGARSAGHRR